MPLLVAYPYIIPYLIQKVRYSPEMAHKQYTVYIMCTAMYTVVFKKSLKKGEKNGKFRGFTRFRHGKSIKK